MQLVPFFFFSLSLSVFFSSLFFFFVALGEGGGEQLRPQLLHVAVPNYERHVRHE